MVVLGAAIAPMVSGVGVGATENPNEASTEINVTINNGGVLKFDDNVTDPLEFATEYTFKEYLNFAESGTSTLKPDSKNNSFELKFTDDRFSAKGYEISAKITKSNLTSPVLNLKHVTINQTKDADKIKYEYAPKRATVATEEIKINSTAAAPVINATRNNDDEKYFGAGSWIASITAEEFSFISNSLTPKENDYSATITWTIGDVTIEGDTP